MSHTVCTRYNIKLNKDHESYEPVIAAIETYLEKCLEMERTSNNLGESYGASRCEFHGELLVSFHSLKSSSPVSLSPAVLALVNDNINTSPDNCYYYLEEEEISGWHVLDAFGKAKPIFERHAEYRRVGSEAAITKFHNELYV